MMLKRELISRDGSSPGVPRRGNRVGSSAFAVFAGVAVVCAGTTAAALAGAHGSAIAAAGNQCSPLPQASSAPPGPTPTVSAGGGSAVSASVAASASTMPGGSTAPSVQICENVSATTASVHPGAQALYTISVSPQSGEATDVTVQISSLPSSMPAPKFTICGKG